MGASFHSSYTVLKGNSVTSKIEGTSLWNFVPNSRDKIFLRYVDHREREKGGCSEHDKLDHCRSSKLTIPLSCHAHPLVCHSNHQALSTAQFYHVGRLAMADTCMVLLLQYKMQKRSQMDSLMFW